MMMMMMMVVVVVVVVMMMMIPVALSCQSCVDRICPSTERAHVTQKTPL